MAYDDPFADSDPTPRSSAFADANSFRARLVMIEPTKIERDIPKSANQPNGPRGDRITANVTVVDGKGDVYAYSQRVRTDKVLEGPLYRKVWFNQDQIVEALLTPDGKNLRTRVFGVLETFKAGQIAGQGNPWTVRALTDAEKDVARKELAGITVSQATQDDESPF